MNPFICNSAFTLTSNVTSAQPSTLTSNVTSARPSTLTLNLPSALLSLHGESLTSTIPSARPSTLTLNLPSSVYIIDNVTFIRPKAPHRRSAIFPFAQCMPKRKPTRSFTSIQLHRVKSLDDIVSKHMVRVYVNDA